MSKAKKSKKARVIVIVAAIFVVLIVAVVLVQFVIGPAAVAAIARREIQQYWVGPVEVAAVDFSFTGPIYLHDVQLADQQGRNWLQLARVRVSLDNWPGLRPQPAVVDMQRLDLRIYLEPQLDRQMLPIDFDQLELDPPEDVNLRQINVEPINVTVTDWMGHEMPLDGLVFSAERSEDIWSFDLRQPDVEPDQQLHLGGRIWAQQRQVDAFARIDRQFSDVETAFFSAVLRVPEGLRSDGAITADISASGNLDEIETLWPSGNVQLRQWRVGPPDQAPLVEDFNADIVLAPGRFDVEEYRGSVARGQVAGDLQGVSDVDEFAVLGELMFADIDIEYMGRRLGTVDMQSGIVAGQGQFQLAWLDLQSLTGQGEIVLDDADFSVLPVVPAVFRVLGVPGLDPLTMTDFDTEFRVGGTVIEIQRGRLANPFAAVEIEPGSQVDFAQRTVDGYVIGVPLQVVRSVLEEIPIIDIFVDLRDRLTRLHVSGSWDDPSVAPRPLEDVPGGTVDFFRDAAETGGDIAEGVLDVFRGLFN